MKKKLLLFAFLVIGIYGFSQVLYSENFSSGSLTDWSGDAVSRFSISQTKKAGAQLPELRMSNSVVLFSSVKLISPVINTTGHQGAVLSFKQMFDFDETSPQPFTFNFLVRKNASSPWQKLDSVSFETNTTEAYVVFIDGLNMNSPDFQFCIEVTGKKVSLIEWCIDDIQLRGLSGTDLALTQVSIPEKVYANQTVSGIVRNMRETPITSFKANWKLANNTVYTTSFTGLNITVGNHYNFICDDVIPFKAGLPDMATIWISDINGGTADDSVVNNQIEKSFQMSILSTNRHPMFEIFTSSTCGPCVPFAEALIQWLPAYGDNVTVLKYQDNFPGTGDPYHTPEVKIRHNFYQIMGVPTFLCDGKKYTTNASPNIDDVKAAYAISSAKPSIVNIKTTHAIEGNLVKIYCTVTPLENISNVNLLIGVLEQITTKNKRSNGQTEFHDVMMKMVPNVTGTPMTLVANIPQAFTFVVDMDTTHVEEMNDLRVVAFAQRTNQEIINSAYSTAVPMIINTNIQHGDIKISTTTNFVATYFDASRLQGGAEITNANVASLISFENSDHVAVPFTATISDDKKIITITPISGLNGKTVYTVKIKSLETDSSVRVPAVIVSFTTIETSSVAHAKDASVQVFPNPTSNGSVIEFQGISNVKNITLLNALGKTIHQYGSVNSNKIELPKALPQGVYFLKFVTAEKSVTTRIVIVK